MCTTRHSAIALASVTIPEETLKVFMILRQAVLKQNVCTKVGRLAEV